MEPAIRVSGVNKNFKLPHQKNNTFKSVFVNALSFRGRSFEVQHALRDINFEVKQGEFFGIVGRNGSGKSTLLKVLAGIYQPNGGSVQVNGRLVPFIELGVGFNGELTGRENVFLNGALLGFSRKEMEAMYDDIVSFAELEQFMDQKLKNYSSGMQVRLAFSLATHAEADILLVDEVLAVGDADFQRKCFDYFRSLKKRKTTVVFVTHDMAAVREYCDRVILVDNSRVVAEGNPDEIATQYTRMFNVESGGKPDGAGKRWGDGSLQYENVKVEQAGGEFGSVKVSADAKVLKQMETLVLGFGVTNGAGAEILGTNTQIKNHRLKKAKAGEIIRIEWEFHNVLADGLQTVSLTAHATDGVQVYDWWEDAKQFRVFKEEQTAYPITPEVKVTSEVIH